MNQPVDSQPADPVKDSSETAISQASTKSQVTGDYVPGADIAPAATPLTGSDRYALGELIGKGGMGGVYRAIDRSLNRDLAFKVLLADPAEKPDLVRRFYQEAEITGQLQHPGVVPIHEIGLLPDGRPFFAMKLVEGHTLAQRLKNRHGLDDLPRLLKIFEQLCQTVAFAHSRGIIHRDLKPANIMVGAFGEVQVMDWGLAKSLRVDSAVESKSGFTSEGDEQHTRSGAILGTLAYMPPEQARGEIDRLDERSDVFSLGAILCEILTGKPPYGDDRGASLLKRAADGDLAGAFSRLDECGVDVDLVLLAKNCLKPRPNDRPASAADVAAAIVAYQAGVEERLRSAEVRRARADARAAEERKRRKVQLALAAALIAIIGLSAAAIWWYQRDRAAQEARQRDEQIAQARRDERERAEQAQREQAEALRTSGIERDALAAIRFGSQHLIRPDAKDLAEDPDDWRQRITAAKANLQTAVNLLKTITPSAQVRAALSQFELDIAGNEKEITLLVALDQIRLDDSIGLANDRQIVARYEQVFLDFGLNFRNGNPKVLEKYVENHPRREWLAAAINSWANRLESNGPDQELWHTLKDALPPNEITVQLSVAYLPPQPRDMRSSSQKVAAIMNSARVKDLPTGRAVWIAESLNDHGYHQHAIDVLQRALDKNPGDYRALYELGRTYVIMRPGQPANALPYLRAAIAVRPRSSAAHSMMGIAFRRMNDLKQSLACHRKAVELDPQFSTAHINLSTVLSDLGDNAGAMDACRRALEIEPDSESALVNYASGLDEAGDVHGAIACYYEVIGLNETKVDVVISLGYLLLDNDEIAEASRLLRLALRWGSSRAESHIFAARIHEKKGDYELAAAQYRDAIRRDPKELYAYTNYALMLRDRKDYPAAIALLKKALEIEPDNYAAIGTIGSMLRSQGQFAEAVEYWQRAAKLVPNGSPLKANMLNAIDEAQPLVQLEAKLKAFVADKVQPKTAAERARLASFARRYKRMPRTAERLFAEAFAADTTLLDDSEEPYSLHAAQAALQAAFGLGDDCVNLDATEKTRLRKQGFEWLKKDFSKLKRDVMFDPTRRADALDELRAYLTVPEFGPIRSPIVLAVLPASERDAWLEWWREWREVLNTK